MVNVKNNVGSVSNIHGSAKALVVTNDQTCLIIVHIYTCNAIMLEISVCTKYENS